MVAGGYTEYDEVKLKLRIDDDSMRDEIQLYMHQIDDLVTNRLIAKIGLINIYGQAITYPLTHLTIPRVPLELKAIANDLVVAKIRLQNSEKPLLWDSAVKVLEDYLERVYGYTSSAKYQPIRTFVISPESGVVGATVTISGTNFQPTSKITIIFDSINPTTTPTSIITSSTGVWTGTFNIPSTQPTGAYIIKAYDDFGGMVGKFQVI